MTDREIYEQLREPLMRFAASLVGRDAAHDLVADAVTATIARRRLADLDNPQAYLMKAVINRARSQSRARTREERAVSRMSADVAAPEPEVGDPQIIETVTSLPMQQRAAIFLVYWEDLSPSEAAEIMGIRPGTLRRYLHLAREKLREHLNE